jgi:probable HAF family extracellular repeat protein
MADALSSGGAPLRLGSTAVPYENYPHAAVFQGSGIRDIGPRGTGSTAYGINDAGRIVGIFVYSEAESHAFVFDLPDGPLRDVSLSNPCGLVAVNGPGDAVGSCSIAAHVDRDWRWAIGTGSG